MKKNITQIAFITLFTLLISFMLSASFPLVVLTILLITIFIQLPEQIHSILFARLSIAILILLSLFQLESVIFWAINLRVTPLIYISASLLITLIWVVYIVVKNKKGDNRLSELKPSRIDLIILLPAFILSGVMLTRAILPQENNMTSIVKSIAYGMDDATHVRLLGDLFRTNSNLTAHRSDTYGNKISSAGAYPLGWHLSTSIIASSITNTESINSHNIVLVYFIAKILSLFGAVASLTFFLVVLAKRMRLKVTSNLDAFTYVSLGTGISFLLILPLYFDGFFSFFPIVTYTMTFAALYIQKVDKKSLPYIETILHLLAIASALTWILTAPILLLALVVRYYQRFTSLKKIPIKYYIFLAFSSLALLTQIISLISNNVPVSSLSAVGGIKSPGPFLLVTMLIVYTAFHISEKEHTHLRNKIYLLLLPALISLAAILLFISISSETITYYFYKFQIVILLLLMPVVFTYLFLVIKRNLKSTKEQLSGVILLGLIVVLSIPSVIGYDYISHIVTRVRYTLISSQVASQIVNTDLNETFSVNNPVTYYLYPNNLSQAILSSNIARINYPATECNSRMFDATYGGDIDNLAKIAIRCSPTTPTIHIYTDQKSYKKLNEIIPSNYLDANEIVIKTL